MLVNTLHVSLANAFLTCYSTLRSNPRGNLSVLLATQIFFSPQNDMYQKIIEFVPKARLALQTAKCKCSHMYVEPIKNIDRKHYLPVFLFVLAKSE